MVLFIHYQDDINNVKSFHVFFKENPVLHARERNRVIFYV